MNKLLRKLNTPIVQGDQRRRGPGGKFAAKKAAGRLLDGRTWDEYPSLRGR